MNADIPKQVPWLVSLKGLINLRNELHLVHHVPAGHYMEDDEIIVYLIGDNEMKQIWIVESVTEDEEEGRDEISLILGWDIQNEPYSDPNRLITSYDA